MNTSQREKRTAKWIRQARGTVRCGHVVDERLTCRVAEPDKPSEWCVGCLLAESVVLMTHVTDDEWEQRKQSALAFLERNGYRYCDTPACNCGSWHKRGE